MSYLELVEEFPNEPEYTQFEKILIASKRAKALHNDDKAPLAYNHLTAPYVALQELREGLILPTYREEEPPADQIEEDQEESEEEED